MTKMSNMNSNNRKWNSLIKNLLANYKKGLQFGLWGASGGIVGSLIGEIIKFDAEPNILALAIRVGIWFGIIGIFISITLLVGYSWYLKRGLRMMQSIKEGILPGFIAGFIAGAIAQSTYTIIGPTEFLRAICWGIAGGLLGFGLSFRIPNLGHLRGLGGGAIGGVIGGCLFILFTFLIGLTAGRLLGIAAIGFFIGLMIVLAEAVFRDAWLVVHWTPTEQKTISLGAKPVIIGSSDESHIYLRKDQGFPAIAAKVYIEAGKIVFDNQMNNQKQTLTNSNKIKLGELMIEVKTSE